MAIKFLRLALLYVIIGVGVGLYMASSHAFEQHSTHAHLNLMGWVSLALFGLIYQVFPELEQHVLAKAHFWLYNLGLPVTLIGVANIYGGNPGLGEPLAGTGSILAALGFLALTANVFRKI